MMIEVELKHGQLSSVGYLYATDGGHYNAEFGLDPRTLVKEPRFLFRLFFLILN
jgi:hypothetical protein